MGSAFGRRIKQRRRELDRSLRKVCQDVLNEDGKPISVSYLNDIEQGYRNPPNGKIIVQLAKALQLDEQALLGLAGRPDPLIEEAMSKDRRVGMLFRKIAKEASHDPGVIERVRKVIEGGS